MTPKLIIGGNITLVENLLQNLFRLSRLKIVWFKCGSNHEYFNVFFSAPS